MTSTTANARAIAYQYDAAGNRTRMTWPDTAFFVTTTYDALNRPLVLSEKGTANLASYAYDDLSRRTVVTLGNGTTTTYGYNPQGDLSTLAHDLASTANDQSYTYTRNQAREIVTHSWSNDLYQWPVTGLVANGTKSFTANGRNQYTTAIGATITHDANGNMTGDGTWTYTYDQNNRLKSANRASPATAITMAYDAEGRMRNTSTSSTSVTHRMYDGTDLVAEYNISGVLQARYVHGPGVDEPLVTYTGTGAATKNWLYADHLGSIVASADSTGAKTDINKYGPFGEPHTLSGGTKFRYTGQQMLGNTGLMYYKARFYDPRLGRFLQTDPIGTADDMNLYAYVGNNSVNSIDPTGLSKEVLANFLSRGIRVINEKVITHGTGIPFKDGFPVFDGVAIKSVNIKQTGVNVTDFALANKAAGLAETPKGYTWHHHQNEKTMQLIPSEIHSSVGHTGGAAMARSRSKQSGAATIEFLVDLLTPVGLLPSGIAPGTLYGPGTAYPTSSAYDAAVAAKGQSSASSSSGK
ncbi:hypothetical protein GCM10007320_22590 [Pseudorhodoferax aquiterrae]|uniref:RHS repeat-associated protein n=1 Tax=Pseudorhodoferax aquiterrae TaxID=747304 RepID=A0ABQ3G1E0_9BURK|nr:RHS repeat-associated core domain-containing protein [Pseudorhodoferax aquiterrae]GHC80715.1 hypothetical protein GCM10007320_22590 [Pseudorhodoferax aquiterrae]